jgi:hypothetical protein
MDESRELTFGEKAVGLTFNPSNDPVVQGVKEQFAAVIDGLNNQRETLDVGSTGSKEKARMLSIAITEAQTAQMWAVKAVTWQY